MVDVNRAAAVKSAERCRWMPFLQGRIRRCAIASRVASRFGREARRCASRAPSAAQSVNSTLFSSLAGEGDRSSAMLYERWPTRALRRTRMGAVASFSLSSRTTTR